MKIGVFERQFADLIWQNEPMKIADLVKKSEEQFGWKRTTTYTVLKRLGDRGLFVNEKGIVHSLITREDFYSNQSHEFIEEHFDGSLPAFLAAFARRTELSPEDMEDIERIIQEYRKADR